MDGTACKYVRNDTAAGGDDAAMLVDSALQLRWSAPELALLLADRAAATGLVGTPGRRAALLAAASLNLLGREVEAGKRALTGLRHLDHGDRGGAECDLDRQLRVELAAAAVAVGAANTALSVLRPVLAVGPGARAAVRASALVQLATALAGLDRAGDAARALREADDLYQDADVEPDPAALLRGTVRAARSAQYRRHGDPTGAESAARDGLELLSDLPDPAQDGGAVGGRLVLELVLALLDRGEFEAAVRAAATVVDGSLRAAAAAPTGWLQLVLATRVHLPAGRHREVLDLLGDAAASAERHSLDPVRAECLDALCGVHEERGEYAEALYCLRSAHAAQYRHRRAADALRIELIEEYGAARRDVAGVAEQVVGLIGTDRTCRRRSDSPGLLDLPGSAGSEADPDDAAATDATAPAVPASPVALIAPVNLVPIDHPPVSGSEPAHQDDPESAAGAGRARHRRDGGRQRPVAELLAAAGRTGRGSPGRRRAEDRADATEDDVNAPEDGATGRGGEDRTAPATSPTLVSEPPLGSRDVADDPTADDQSRAERGWSPQENIRSGRTAPAVSPPAVHSFDSITLTDRIGAHSSSSRGSGLGDLLAEALAAFEEGRSQGSDIRAADDPATEPVAPVGAGGSDPGSELGISDATGEQVWQLPGRRRHSAAGD